MKKMLWGIGVLVVLSGAIVLLASRPRPQRMCRFVRSPVLSMVDYGNMVESMPSTGKIQNDSSVIVEVDELYLPRISVGLLASSEFNGNESKLVVTEVDTILNAGRFWIRLSFKDGIPKDIRHDGSVRMRIYLSDPFQATRLPVGGFHKETGGKWIFVLLDESHVVKRNIKLGRRSPDYFEVLEGLQPGEKVVTSPTGYDKDLDFTKPVTIQELEE